MFSIKNFCDNMKRVCGYCSRINNVPLLQFRLLFRDKVYHRCSCGKVSCYRMIAHYPHDTTDVREKEENKLYDDGKGVWKNG